MPDPTAIVTLDDVHTFIGLTGTQPTRVDTVLQEYIDSATVWATYVSDAILPQTFTNEVHSGGGPTIVLFNTPIMTVTSVIEYVGNVGYTLTEAEAGGNLPYSYSIDNASAGILTRRWNGVVGNFVGGRNNIVVTYKAGFAVVPADIKIAVLSDIQVLYNQTAQGRRAGTQGEQFSSTLPLNTFPRLASLLASSRRVPAIG